MVITLTELLERARAEGTPKQYKLWLRTQPSAIDGTMDYDLDTGVEYCDPCHYRTARNSGIACKPDCSAIPMSHRQHLEQHRIGQFNFKPREWWEYQCVKYLRLWLNS
jgi:hypothetical protein